MRILAYIIILIMQWIPLLASDDRVIISGEIFNTVNNEEVTASWEKNSEAGLLGERVLEDFRNNSVNGFSLNASCSAESIVKYINLRKISTEIISASLSDAVINRQVELAIKILSKIESISMTPLTSKEKELIILTENIKASKDEFTDNGFSSGTIPLPEFASSTTGNLFSAPYILKLNKHSESGNRINNRSTYIQCRKDLFDSEFADLYRLFLYVRDNSANGKTHCLTYNGSIASPLPLLYILTRYKKTSKSNTRISSAGVPI